MKKLPLILVADNIRSAHNVGALLRCADGAGIEKVILTGISPHLRQPNDPRPPYVIAGAEKAISKTALGAEKSVLTEYASSLIETCGQLKTQGKKLYALEQAPGSKSIFEAKLEFPAALIVGKELGGISEEVLGLVNEIVEIPMYGKKDSLNVSAAAAVAIFEVRRLYK